MKNKDGMLRLMGILGIVSLLSYAAAVILSPLAYPGYDRLAQAVSDLSADTAPSLGLWKQLSSLYGTPGIVCAMFCCYSVRARSSRALRLGVYLYTVMLWVSSVGYHLFPLTEAGSPNGLQNTMHLVVTAAVVLLSIASLLLTAVGGIRGRLCVPLGVCALIAFTMMLLGAVGTGVLPRSLFGLAERFSVFASAGYTAALGTCLYLGIL